MVPHTGAWLVAAVTGFVLVSAGCSHEPESEPDQRAPAVPPENYARRRRKPAHARVGSMIPEYGRLGVHQRIASQGFGPRAMGRPELRGSRVSVVEAAEVRNRDDVAAAVLDEAWRWRVAIESQVGAGLVVVRRVAT